MRSVFFSVLSCGTFYNDYTMRVEASFAVLSLHMTHSGLGESALDHGGRVGGQQGVHSGGSPGAAGNANGGDGGFARSIEDE
jgi:hypothetical protein